MCPKNINSKYFMNKIVKINFAIQICVYMWVGGCVCRGNTTMIIENHKIYVYSQYKNYIHT